MSGVLIDSNILIDVLTEDPNWFGWSAEQLEQLGNRHILYINEIVYAEVSMSFNEIEEFEQALPSHLFKRLQLPWEAAFLAGKAFLKYRKNRGTRTTALPDFFIGAHAAIDNLILLTRDGKRFQHYFPKLKVISPNASL
jgi:predicted nucleic acid-binding protein